MDVAVVAVIEAWGVWAQLFEGEQVVAELPVQAWQIVDDVWVPYVPFPDGVRLLPPGSEFVLVTE